MIQLTVTKSNDIDKLGKFTFYKNLIYIGSHNACDLFIDDNNLDKNHVFIEIVEGKLLVHLGKNTEKILVAGKITTGHKYISTGVTIELNGNTIVIELFAETIPTNYKNELNTLTEKIIESQPKVLAFLQELHQK